jgi:hypothetical protein
MLGRFCCALLFLTACSGSKRQAVEDLSQHEDLSLFKLQSVRGTRDGDRLAAHAMFSDSSSMLTVDLHFAIGSPTRLESGTWRWTRTGGVSSGEVSSRSVTFLGGQDGPPSIGGSFELLGSGGGTPLFRVNFPVTELKRQ